MKTVVRTRQEIVYVSETRSEITTLDENLKEAITWVDAHPIVWKIVGSRSRSAVFGAGSSTYIGWAQRGDHATALLERVRTFHAACTSDRDDFERWRACYTLEHFRDRGFRGGLFEQWDGEYRRGCHYLDYTPATLNKVIDRFLRWCDVGWYRSPTVEVRIDGKTVRKMAKGTAVKTAAKGTAMKGAKAAKVKSSKRGRAP